MSFEILEKLERRVQSAIETIELQQLELEEERAKYQQLQHALETVQAENQELKQSLSAWHQKTENLLNRIELPE